MGRIVKGSCGQVSGVGATVHLLTGNDLFLLLSKGSCSVDVLSYSQCSDLLKGELGKFSTVIFLCLVGISSLAPGFLFFGRSFGRCSCYSLSLFLMMFGAFELLYTFSDFIFASLWMQTCECLCFTFPLVSWSGVCLTSRQPSFHLWVFSPILSVLACLSLWGLLATVVASGNFSVDLSSCSEAIFYAPWPRFFSGVIRFSFCALAGLAASHVVVGSLKMGSDFVGSGALQGGSIFSEYF